MIKKLASYIAEFKKDTILTPVYVALEAILETIIPLLMAWINDIGIIFISYLWCIIGKARSQCIYGIC